MEKKPPKRMTRGTFWAWVIPIVLAHTVLAMTFGLSGLWNVLDLALIFLLATAFARRFRDIGWPAWTGPTFVIVTILVIPFCMFAYALASHATIEETSWWVTVIGGVIILLNLVLIIVAGCVPGRPDAGAEIRAEFS